MTLPVALALAVALAGSFPAAAATLLAPPVLVLESDQIAQCNATNTSETKPIDVVVELYDPNGATLDTSALTLPPLGTRTLASSPGPFLAVGCRLSFSGGRKKVRGTLIVIRTGADSEMLAVMPAE